MFLSCGGPLVTRATVTAAGPWAWLLATEKRGLTARPTAYGRAGGGLAEPAGSAAAPRHLRSRSVPALARLVLPALRLPGRV